MKVEQNKKGQAYLCACAWKFFWPNHAHFWHSLDDINNDLCIINGHYLHIILPINMCAEEAIPALRTFRAGTNSFFDLFFVMALSLGRLMLI